MGRITSAWNAKGITVAGVTLGEPATDGDLFVWDGDVPDGTLDDVGNIITPNVGEVETPNVPLDAFVGVSGQEIPEPDVPEVVVEQVAPELLDVWLAAADEVAP